MNRKSMYQFDCMIFNPAGGCAWRYESDDLDELISAVLKHLGGASILVKEHGYPDTDQLRKKIKSAVTRINRKCADEDN